MLVEEKVLRRRYEGGSRGASIRIMKGVSYRVGGHRGHIVTDTGLVPVGDGNVVITNKRVAFTGQGKSFAAKLDQLLDAQAMSNGLILSENNKAKQRMIIYKSDENQDIVGAVLSYAINHYGEPLS